MSDLIITVKQLIKAGKREGVSVGSNGIAKSQLKGGGIILNLIHQVIYMKGKKIITHVIRVKTSTKPEKYL